MRNIITSVFILVLAIGCASKKPVESTDITGAGATSPDMTTADIQDRELKMDPCGTDCGSIPGLETVNFPFDSSQLTEETRTVLNKNADWLKTNPAVTLQVEGHCDSKGSDEYNRSLGARRAEVVKSYLTGLGVEAGRLSTISWGEEKLIAVGDSEADHAKNRRANFSPAR